MPYSLDDKLVVAVASSALFDLGEADRIFRESGTDVYRRYQRDHEADVLAPGVAFPLVQKLLSLNGASDADRVVEVILLSRNDRTPAFEFSTPSQRITSTSVGRRS